MLKYLRFLLSAIHIFVVTVIGQIFSLFRPFNSSNLYYFSRMISWVTQILGIKFRLINEHYIPKGKPVVYISNHQHNIDVMVCSIFLPKRAVSIGKMAILYVPFFGTFFALTGNILINRKNKQKAYQTLDKAQIALTQKNTSIWIMPEGTRSGDKGVQPFKKGAFLLAINAEVPIIPISISSYSKYVDFNRLRGNKVIAQIHPPVSTQGLSIDDAITLADKCYEIIKNGNQELDDMIFEENSRG